MWVGRMDVWSREFGMYDMVDGNDDIGCGPILTALQLFACCDLVSRL